MEIVNSRFPEFLELGNVRWCRNGEVFCEIAVFRLLGFWGPGAQGPWGPGTLGVPLFNRMPHPSWKIILTCLDKSCGAPRSHDQLLPPGRVYERREKLRPLESTPTALVANVVRATNMRTLRATTTRKRIWPPRTGSVKA